MAVERPVADADVPPKKAATPWHDESDCCPESRRFSHSDNGEKILKKSNKGCCVSLFFFPVMHLPGFIINRTKQLGSFVFAVRWHFALFATRKPIVLQGLIGANHGFVLKEQMVDYFSLHLLLEIYEGMLFEQDLGVLVGVGKGIVALVKLKFIRFSIALIPRTLIFTPNSRLIHSATSGSV